MTAVTHLRSGGRGVLLLTCDQCGRRSDTQVSIRDWAVLWAAATRAGWQGREELFGPHYCPSCSR